MLIKKEEVESLSDMRKAIEHGRKIQYRIKEACNQIIKEMLIVNNDDFWWDYDKGQFEINQCRKKIMIIGNFTFLKPYGYSSTAEIPTHWLWTDNWKEEYYNDAIRYLTEIGWYHGECENEKSLEKKKEILKKLQYKASAFEKMTHEERIANNFLVEKFIITRLREPRYLLYNNKTSNANNLFSWIDNKDQASLFDSASHVSNMFEYITEHGCVDGLKSEPIFKRVY